MRISILTISLAVVCGVSLSCMSPGAQAQGEKSGKANLSAMAQGPEVTATNGRRYVVLPGARAAQAEDANEEPALVLARAGASGKEVLERKGSFVIYRDAASQSADAARSAASAKLAVQGATNPVLLNTKTGGLAVVTGTLRVKLKGGTLADLAAAHGLTLGESFPRRSLAYFTAAPGADLLATVEALRADPRVAEADLEVMEHVRVPH